MPGKERLLRGIRQRWYEEDTCQRTEHPQPVASHGVDHYKAEIQDRVQLQGALNLRPYPGREISWGCPAVRHRLHEFLSEKDPDVDCAGRVSWRSSVKHWYRIATK